MAHSRAPDGLPRTRLRNALLLGLSFASGSLDALSYLLLSHVFVAFMTGNTVLLGVAIGQRQGGQALHSLDALVCFAAGVVVSSLLAGRQGGVSPWPVAMTITLSLETPLLVALAVVWTLPGGASGGVAFLLIGCAGAAMGLQSAAVQQLGIAGVSTTFVTGTLTSAISRGVALLVPGWMPVRPVGVGPWSLPAAVYAAYALGAVVGGVGALAGASRAVWVPVGTVLAVLAIDLIARRRRA